MSELRTKQLQGQQKSATIQKQTLTPYQHDIERDDHFQHNDGKNRDKIYYQQRQGPQYPTEYIPHSADELGHRYLKSSEDSSLYRSNQKAGIYKPPIHPVMGYQMGEDKDMSVKRRFAEQVY